MHLDRLDSRPRLWVAIQQVSHEIDNVRLPKLLGRELELHLLDIGEHDGPIGIVKGWEAMKHFVYQDAKRPPISTATVATSIQDLRGGRGFDDG